MAGNIEVGHGYKAITDDDQKVVLAFETCFKRYNPTFENHGAAKEFLITHTEAQGLDELVSPLMVCKSGAGYYVGTMCIHDMHGEEEWIPLASWLIEPHSRESYHYYSTYDEALTRLVNETWIPRL
jgi:hypothetical protein